MEHFQESINEDEVVQISTEQLLAGFLDPDSVFDGLDPTAGLRITGLPTSPNGVITQKVDVFTFTPDLNFNGSTQVSFTITDGVNETLMLSSSFRLMLSMMRQPFS